MAINAELLLHPSDKTALQALRAIPGFAQLVKAYMGIMNERQYRILNKAGKVQLGPEQMPEYWNMLPPICARLGIAVPELYLELDVVPNAYTYGDTKPFIVMTSGLLETMPDELIPTILAHECGHIACHHTLYTTIGSMILNGTLRYLTGFAGLLTIPLEMAFAYWMRCSEFSADRAAVLCDGGSKKMEEVCFRLAGNDKDIRATTSVEAFMKQAEEYRQLVTDDKWNKTLEFIVMSFRSHPMVSVRALECREWAASEQFGKVTALLRSRMPDALTAACDIPAPESSGGCVRKDREEIRASFAAEGFRNIVLVRSFEKGPAARSGQIISALIDGEKAFEKGEWIPSDARLVMTYYEPKSAEEIAAEHPGELLLPRNASAYIGRDSGAVAEEFRKLGFTALSVEPLTVRRSWLTREGGIAKISVDGDEKFRQGRWVDAGAKVCILFNRFEEQPPAGQGEAGPKA